MASRGFRDNDEYAAHDFPLLLDVEDSVEPQSHTLHVHSDSESSNPLPLPVWMRESSNSFRYRWVPLPLRKAGRAAANWIKGPQPPRDLHITLWLPRIQEAPIRLLDRYAPKRRHRIMLLLVLYATWLLTWSLMLWHNSTSGFIKGYGKPASLWCGASFWNAGNGCGVNGNGCRPFSTSHLAFRC